MNTNASVLAVLDSRRTTEAVRAAHTVFSPLDHFGPAVDVYELGAATVSSDFATDQTRDPMAPPAPRETVDRYVGDRAVIVLAHDGAGSMPVAMAERVAAAVEAGAGLLSFDREVDQWPDALRRLVPTVAGRETLDALRLSEDRSSFILHPHPPGEVIGLRSTIRGTVFADPCDEVLARTATGAPLVVAGTAGAGRFVLFGTGDLPYDEAVLGHAHGITGLFWRSLVWAARKPFPMRCMPPYLTARFDDCSGSHNAFDYVTPLNRHGLRPNLGLFIDEMSERDWQAASRLCAADRADFSMHAFRDDLLRVHPAFRTFGSYDHKPQHAEPAFHSFTLDHYTGEDFDEATVRAHFDDMDRRFSAHGVRHSRILNAHFAEIGLRAVPLFLGRGIEIEVNNVPPGRLYGNQPAWRPRPFGLRSPQGRHGLVHDYSPCRSGLFIGGVGLPPTAAHFMESDVLWGHTPFLGEADRVRIDDAVARAVRNAQWAWDALSFGVFMSHEQRVASIPPDAWDSLFDRLAQAIEGEDVVYAGREEVGLHCKRIFDSRLHAARMEDGELVCRLSGQTDGPSPLTVWTNEGASCQRHTFPVDAIRGVATVRIPIPRV